MFKFFFKPQIKAKLINDRTAKIVKSNISSRETFMLLYLIVRHISNDLNIDPRELINKLKDLHRNLSKIEKNKK